MVYVTYIEKKWDNDNEIWTLFIKNTISTVHCKIGGELAFLIWMQPKTLNPNA